MTGPEQLAFVRDLSAEIVKRFAEHVDAGKIPENWDGHEIRCWLADRHALSAATTAIRRNPRQKRARDYRNEVIINNL
jgi:hypothetical protein